MADVIRFNLDHFEEELKWFGQQWFEISESQPYSEAVYLAKLAEARRLGGVDGIDAALAGMTSTPSWLRPAHRPGPMTLVNGDHFLGGTSSPAAIAGYPLITVPMGDASACRSGSPSWGRPIASRR